MTAIYIPEAQRPSLSAHARKLADLGFRAVGITIGTSTLVLVLIGLFGA
ncbi:hypothetical protein [uncultured Cohaesibacter sp.]|nr:hypothetical protein [uncultured Cohaesibacter sp.]